MKTPLLAPLLAVSAGIALARFIAWSGRDFAWSIPLLIALTAFAAARCRRVLPACLAVLFVFSSALIAYVHRPGAPPELDAGAREIVAVDGCVVSPSAFSEDRDQFVVELAPGARARVSLMVHEGEPMPDLRYGERVELEARLRRIRNFHNPGAFDYEGFAERSDIYWTASAMGADAVTVKPGRCGSRFSAVVYALRTAALRRIERLYLGNAYATGMLEATLIGESSRMERVWTDHFRRTGTYHMLVIDGLHITILAACVLFLLRLCFLPEITALAITASGAWLYALVSGWNAPVIRAAGGFTLYVIARYFYRRGRLLNLLSAIAIIYLVCDPSELFQAGFQLSFLCVAAIGLLAVPLLDATSSIYARGIVGITQQSRVPRLPPRAAHFRLELRLLAETASYYLRLPREWWERGLAFGARVFFFAYDLAVVSAAIQIGLALPMAIYFHRISLTGVSANVLVVPLLGLVVPLGFLAIFTNWHVPAAIAGWLLSVGERVADWHTRLEPQWRVLAPPLWLAILFTVSLILLAWAMQRSVRLSVGALAAVAALFALIFVHPFAPSIRRGQLELTAIDVGQGDSLLVCFPDSKIMLVDGGGVLSFGRHAPARLDIGEDVVSPYLWSRSIQKIDVVALTHAHDDHAGGLPAVIENFHPTQLWTGATPESAAWTAVREKARAGNVKITALSSGRTFDFGGAHVEVISPSLDYSPAGGPTNDDSLGLRITYGARSILLTGDMERPSETRALEDARPLRADILKVGHHGSNTSNSGAFLDAVSPEFAVISDGYENSFHHPHPKVLERLRDHRVGVLRTDQDGLVTIRTDGRRITVETFRIRGASDAVYPLPGLAAPAF